MAEDVPLSCTCGNVRCVVRDAGPEHGDRLVCHCNDCRDFVRLLGREAEVLTEHGGVSIYHTRVGNLELVGGADSLAAVHLTEKPLLRWYAACCNTPLFSTTDKAPKAFLSINTFGIAPCDRDRVLGPPIANLFVASATRPDPPGKAASILSMLPRFLPRIFKDSFGGGWRKSPLFDPQTQRPIAAPRRLADAEKRRLGRG